MAYETRQKGNIPNHIVNVVVHNFDVESESSPVLASESLVVFFFYSDNIKLTEK